MQSPLIYVLPLSCADIYHNIYSVMLHANRSISLHYHISFPIRSSLHSLISLPITSHLISSHHIFDLVLSTLLFPLVTSHLITAPLTLLIILSHHISFPSLSSSLTSLHITTCHRRTMCGTALPMHWSTAQMTSLTLKTYETTLLFILLFT